MTLRRKLRPEISIRPRAQVEDFEPGSVHTAHIPARNPTEAAWDYRIEVSLWAAAVSPTAWPSLHLEPGQEAILDLALTMPQAEGDHPLKLKAWVGEEYLGEEEVALISVVAPVMLGASQMRTVLQYVFCNRHLDPTLEYFKGLPVYNCTAPGYGAAWGVVVSSPCGFIASQSDRAYKEAADQVAEEYAPGDEYALGRTYLAAYLYYPGNYMGVAYVCYGYYAPYAVLPTDVCQAVISNLTARPNDLWKEMQSRLKELHDQKMDSWLATAPESQLAGCSNYNYSQCLTAFAQPISAYISQWGAPISIDDFLDWIRRIRGDQGVSDARWAIENILGVAI